MPRAAFRTLDGDLIAQYPDVELPIPAHAQTEGAEAARESMRRLAKRRDDLELIIDAGRDPVEPYPDDPVTANARKLLATAERLGFTTNLVELSDRCTVEGFHREREVAFRAYWTRGRADGASWHERRYRYGIVSDTRPVKMDQKAHVGLKGYRSAGVGETHLAILGSPVGVPINHTELTERLDPS